MGNTQSGDRASTTSSSIIPDNEFTRTAMLLKGMNVRLVVFNFLDLFGDTVVVSEPLSVYTPQARLAAIEKLVETMPDTVSAFILSLVAQGVTVAISCPSSKRNGEVVVGKSTQAAGYMFQGIPLVNEVMARHFGPEIAQFIVPYEGANFLGNVRKAAKNLVVEYSEILVIHHDPDIVRQARKLRMSAMMVTDHQIGFRA